MYYLKRTFLPAICLTLIAAFTSVDAQEKPQTLQPDQKTAFTLSPGERRAFAVPMKQDGYAEISWVVGEKLVLEYEITDSSGKRLQSGDSNEQSSVSFVAPVDGEYTFTAKFGKNSESTGSENVSLEYKSVFKLPAGAKQKDIRKVNGYDVRIMTVEGSDTESGISALMIEKAGKLKMVLKQDGGMEYMGFSFLDNPSEMTTPGQKLHVSLLKSTPDITGDGIPDVMVSYFTGGAHCCFQYLFINLGDRVEIVTTIDTENAGMMASGKNPKGGLRFETNDNAFAYWNTSFAGSPMPSVTLEFDKGVLRTNFDAMKKPPPTATALKAKAHDARLKMNNKPYTGVDTGEFEDAFWGEMLDLIYAGNETQAWQYFDLVWPAEKPGKDVFLKDFKSQLAEGYYGKK
jgi:hypothetical protein